MTNNKYNHTAKKKQKRLMTVKNKKKHKTLRQHIHTKNKTNKTNKTNKKFHLKGGQLSIQQSRNSGIYTTNYIEYIKSHFSTPEKAKQNKIDSNNDTYYYDLPRNGNIVTFADVHGDFPLLVKCLTLAGVMKSTHIIPIPDNNGIRNIEEMQNYFNKVEWIGGSTMVVQLGDQIDRSRDTETHSSYKDEGSTFEIVYLLLLLNRLAQTKNNTKQKYVFSMLGNHELMNVQGDLRYVSKAEIKAFTKVLGKLDSGESSTGKLSIDRNSISDKSDSTYWRRYAYKPGHIMSNLMATCYHTLLQIGPFLFVHGGITKDLLVREKMDLFNINNTVKKYLYDELDKNDNEIMETIIGNNGLVWDRTLSEIPHKSMTNTNDSELKIKTKNSLSELFDLYSKQNPKNPIITLMCVGHTPQKNEQVNLLFQDREKQLNNRDNIKRYTVTNPDVLRLDTGSSRAFGKRIKGDLRDHAIARIKYDGQKILVEIVH